MKTLLPIIILLTTLLTFQMCATKPQADLQTCFTGKLVKRGICGQRVVQLVDGPKEGLAFARNWTDSLSGKQYTNVFTVANPCDFPATIEQDVEFTFSLTTTPGSGCIQCYAYTPVPGERNFVVVGCGK
jgi:hypothetical protein